MFKTKKIKRSEKIKQTATFHSVLELVSVYDCVNMTIFRHTGTQYFQFYTSFILFRNVMIWNFTVLHLQHLTWSVKAFIELCFFLNRYFIELLKWLAQLIFWQEFPSSRLCSVVTLASPWLLYPFWSTTPLRSCWVGF